MSSDLNTWHIHTHPDGTTEVRPGPRPVTESAPAESAPPPKPASPGPKRAA